MAGRTSKPRKPAKAAPESRVLGRKVFAAITAVEGLRLGPSSRKRLDALAPTTLTADEKRAEVLRAYAPSKKRK